jgi:hypothetical protein
VEARRVLGVLTRPTATFARTPGQVRYTQSAPSTAPQKGGRRTIKYWYARKRPSVRGHSIMLQKTIQLMIVQKKKQLAKDNNTDPLRNVLGLQANDTSNSQSIDENQPNGTVPSPTQNICYANKCRLLKAKGIIRRHMYCIRGKNMCSGCKNEELRH